MEYKKQSTLAIVCPNGCGPLKYKRLQYLTNGRKAYYYSCPVCGFERRDIPIPPIDNSWCIDDEDETPEPGDVDE